MAIRPGDWLAVVRREYLTRYIPEGGSAIRFVIGEEPELAEIRRGLSSLASDHGFDLMEVDAAKTKLHMIHDVFFALARRIDWETLAQHWVEMTFRVNHYEWTRPGEPAPIEELSAANTIAEPLLRKQAQQWLTAGIMHDREMAQDFRAAMTNLCLRRMEMSDARAVTPVLEWLRGELRSISTVREASISARITRHNGRAMLQSLFRWLQLTGRPGLAVTLDLRQVLQAGPATAESLRYTPAAALDAFEVLRQLIDEVESLTGAFIVVLADTAFEDDPKRSVSLYPALKERIWPDVHPRGRDNPLAPLLHLSADADQPPGLETAVAPFSAQRVAVEALRAGVPNRSAIRLLGSNEPTLIERFGERLARCEADDEAERLIEGEIVAGGFGSGKSHLLGTLAERALQENFIVSRLVISKETPLFDPDRLFAAAMRHSVVPGANDDVMTAVISRLDPGSPAFERLEAWASGPRSGLSPLFAALLFLIPKQVTTADDLAAIARFLGGAKLGMTKVRQWLRAAGAAKLFDIRPVKAADLAVQRLQFASRLFKAAGFGGWCVLLDEVELIGRYSPLQRGRSYAELCRWLCLSPDVGIPGIVSVCAITDDFKDAVLDRRLDTEKIPRALEAKGLDRQARLAELAMSTIERRQHFLAPPDESRLRQGLQSVGGLYETAYGWPPPLIDVGERLTGKTIRQYTKSWITDWDIQRLYRMQSEIATESMASDYTENQDLEAALERDVTDSPES
ncbi:BREX system ATP-binding domain-containing protein [Aurantimonas sp. C2-4-R8]|uniref:BREX system ATP-binding domain-containing protein n=1 Tax=Aurantimonas sp. C2-4-R8 TaxID=3114364 RepID=UPI002E19783D|nr:BREX system ATP-binding domain-containing protein [Aurantimonas sp. C2-4-R8]